ncbi:hypothetical protein D3C80_461810 [compost metagenome]
MVQITRCQLGEFLAQLDGDGVGHVRERVGIRQLAHLVGDGQGHFFAAKANVGAPHATDRIEETVTLGVTNIGALPGNNVQRALFPVLVKHVVAVHVVGLVGFHQGIVDKWGCECVVWRSHGQVLGDGN